MGQFYRDYADYLAERFEGKVQKLTVNAGFSCPNRDGTLGRGGCVYCNNISFSPQIAAGDVVRQLEEGKRFFARKYPHMRYLAYFQSYTNTHGPIEELMELYARAAGVEGVVGIIIGTRPDCVPATGACDDGVWGGNKSRHDPYCHKPLPHMGADG